MLPNEQTLQFSQAKLKVKDSLRFTMRRSGGEIWYMIEDEVTRKFFQVGLPQYTFLSLLNGKRTVSDALMRTATLLRQHAVDELSAAQLCQWAMESGLVETEVAVGTERRAKKQAAETARKAASWLNPISLKIPLFNPDGMATVANRYLGWLIGPTGFVVWFAVVMFGGFQLLTNFDRFANERVTSFSANDLMWFVLTWLLLKLVHESAHGLVCKRLGGRVTSFGFLFLLLIPLPYVDVTTSWRFNNKWHRILTSSAGMLVEVFIAAIACIVWVDSNPGPIQYHAGNIVIAATLHTLLFNANPLMKFDGYYMLSDWLEIPNLSDHGRRFVKATFKCIYFGNEMKPLNEIGWRSRAVQIYGWMSVAWFFVISIGLAMAASSLLDGIGLVVAGVGLILWFVVPVVKFLFYVVKGAKLEVPNRKRFAIAATTTCCVLALLLTLCPSPSVVTAPVVIDFEPLSIVRPEVSGFAKKIHVVNGQKVTAGDLLVTLENHQLKSDLKSAEVDLEIARLRSNALLDAGEIALMNLERESLLGFEKRVNELAAMVALLSVRAQQDGEVLGRALADKEGTYLSSGEEILAIGQLGKLHAVALARQQDVQWLQLDRNDGGTNETQVGIRIWGHPSKSVLAGTITTVNPRARDDMPHQAFAASNSGPLAVVPRQHVQSMKARMPDNGNASATKAIANEGGANDEMILTQPRVPIEITLSPADAAELWAGQAGQMVMRGRTASLGGYLGANLMRFFRHNNTRTHGL